jgi:hypothetical protein
MATKSQSLDSVLNISPSFCQNFYVHAGTYELASGEEAYNAVKWALEVPVELVNQHLLPLNLNSGWLSAHCQTSNLDAFRSYSIALGLGCLV